MENNFYNKVVWITGASSGIGEALVYQFDKFQAKLIISARNIKALEMVKQKCFHPENIFTLPLDLSKAEEISSKAETAISIYGRIDYMIHNAGIVARDKAEDTTADVDRMIMETNYFGPVALTKALLPKMKENRSGHFAVISSLSGKYGVPKLSAYAAAKHALHGFFESLRAETYDCGIRISLIIPGFIKTNIITNGTDGKGTERRSDLDVNNKGMKPAKCAAKIVKAIVQKKAEALIGGSEILTVYLYRFFPNLLRRMMRNHPVKTMKKVRSYFAFTKVQKLLSFKF